MFTNAKHIVLYLLLIIHYIPAATQDKKGKWVEGVIAVSHQDAPNASLYREAKVTAYICDENGRYNPSGFYVMLRNEGSQTLYFKHHSSGYYKQLKNVRYITWSPANIMYWDEVPPGGQRRLSFMAYLRKEEINMPKNMVARFKYFVEEAKPQAAQVKNEATEGGKAEEEGSWKERIITIHYDQHTNPDLQQAEIQAYTCDHDGVRNSMGRCVYINNMGKYPVYYSTGTTDVYYASLKKAKYLIWTPANVVTPFPVEPGEKKIFCYEGYENADSRKLPMKMQAMFRYFIPDDKKPDPPPANEDTVTAAHPGGNTVPGNTSCYVFFSTDVLVVAEKDVLVLQPPNRFLIFISAPLLHKGRLDDPMTGRRQQFFQQVIKEKQVINELPGMRGKTLQFLKGGNNDAIDIHLSRPYSTVLLRNAREAEEAIEEYKNMTRKTLDGLTQYEFIHLK